MKRTEITPEQRKVQQLSGMPVAVIASWLSMSTDTVKAHKKAISDNAMLSLDARLNDYLSK